ncbi:hypothetical protein H5410_026164 [Solanum commersonii]|uniref:Uncharacterized protein n=1 Tax=Solanum commersonii TaxID=4109 RepID=A0A9J5YXZ3_SOLCO|nr:hypothetical protein H5410_026164 [Solanum commersonii]
MVTIYQFKAIKEKHLTMLDQDIMEIILSCKSKLLKEGYYCSIQAIISDVASSSQAIMQAFYYASSSYIGRVLFLNPRLSMSSTISRYHAWINCNAVEDN